MRPTALPALLLSACAALPAQGVYQNANKPGDAVCPKLELDKDPRIAFGAPSAHTTGGQAGADALGVRWYQRGTWVFPKVGRQDMSRFTAYDEHSKGTSIASLKGKFVLIGLWGRNCEPSAKMLMEFAELYGRREKFGFEILSVNFERNQLTEDSQILGGWAAIKRFQSDNRAFFRDHPLPLSAPGTGEEVAIPTLSDVKSLPVMILVDKEGRMGSLDIGYSPKMAAQRLTLFIREANGETVIQAPVAPQAPSAPDPKDAPTR